MDWPHPPQLHELSSKAPTHLAVCFRSEKTSVKAMKGLKGLENHELEGGPKETALAH